MDDRSAVVARFGAVFGPSGRVHAVRAPGRVNLLGEHTDYNEGFVLPLAVGLQVLMVCRGRDDGLVRVASEAFGGQIIEFSTNEKITASAVSAGNSWANYVRGVVAEMIAAGVPLAGMDALISADLPGGSGLASSAAVEVATARALLCIAGLTMDANRLAMICQHAEQVFAGVPCGIMDQLVIASARPGHAMLLDCRDLSTQQLPVDERDLRIVIIDTMVRHQLAGSAYAERREQCQAGLAVLRGADASIRALRDATMEQLEGVQGRLDDVVYRRCRHVITENARAVEAAAKLSRRFYDEVGLLMVQGHQSLRGDYEVSCPELDFLVDEAMKVKGVYGARMTGAGFGGCVVALVIPRAVEQLTQQVSARYQQKFAKMPTIYATTAAAGAEVLS